MIGHCGLNETKTGISAGASMKMSTLETLRLVVVLTVAILFAGCRRVSSFTHVIDGATKPRTANLQGLNGGPTRFVGVMVGPDGREDEFVINEVMFHPKSKVDLDAFLTKYDGTVVRDGTPIIIPGGTPPKENVQRSNGWYLIRVNPTRSSLSDLTGHMEASGLHGQFKFSSEDAARLAALVAREKRKGDQRIAPNFVTHQHCDVCEHPDGSGGNVDAGKFWWMTEDDDLVTPGEQGLSVGVIHAWEYLRYMHIPPPPPGGIWQPPIVAIVDGGFDLDETTGKPLGGNRDYFFLGDRPMQGDVVDHDYTAGGPHPDSSGVSDPARWHGQMVFGIAAAYPQNLFGSAGTGGTVVRPMLIKTDNSFYNDAMGVRTAAFNGASVINMSFGGDCNWLCRTFTDGLDSLQAEIGFAEAVAGAISVASAGNEGKDLTDEYLIPCKLNSVVCVGSINGNQKNVYNYGRGVHIWAPTGILTTVTRTSSGSDADTVGIDEVQSFFGTSASAPFVGGIVGLMKALDPSLSSETVKSILRNTANHSSDAKVTGYVDAYRAVAAVRPNQAPAVQISSPRDGESVSWGGIPSFSAAVVDPESRTRFEGTVTFSSDREGSLCTGTLGCVSRQLSLGSHRITAEAIDPFGARGSHAITVNVINVPPTSTITYPPNGSNYFTSQQINFRGFGFDRDERIPESNLTWSSNISGPLGTGRDVTVRLSQAVHTITLMARDTQGLTGQSSISVTVQAGAGYPTARILSPADNAYLAPGTLVAFQGQGTDPEDGTLGGAQLRWFSSIDGVLGEGASVQRVLSGPPRPCNPETVVHVITLKVTDRDGRQSTHQINVVVGRVC